MSAKKPQKNKIMRIIKIPFRALGKIRTFYVKSMMNYAGKMNYGNRPSHIPGLPKSYSATSARSYDSEDFRELVRAASARTAGTRFDFDSPDNRPRTPERVVSGAVPEAPPPRSKSVVMGRIDEDSPVCYFGGDSKVNGVKTKNDVKYPRSRSHAVGRGTAF